MDLPDDRGLIRSRLLVAQLNRGKIKDGYQCHLRNAERTFFAPIAVWFSGFFDGALYMKDTRNKCGTRA